LFADKRWVRQAFDSFVKADEAEPTLIAFERLKTELKLTGDGGYESLKSAITPVLPHKHKQLFSVLDGRWALNESLRKWKLRTLNVVVSGAGPCGLRAAVELALLGHSVTIVELRGECSRHNILKTWIPTIDDLMNLGLRSFVPGFKPHGHLHLGTRELQLTLLKACLG
jgi:hypothetical protein